jgi:hypothetical protein
MRDTHVPHVDVSGPRARLRIAARADGPRGPAWSFLAFTMAVGMALWALGVIELPVADRREVDWVGGLGVLTILVMWVRANRPSLAAVDAPPPEPEGRLHVRMIRSRRPPLPSMDGPEIAPLRRRTDRPAPP